MVELKTKEIDSWILSMIVRNELLYTNYVFFDPWVASKIESKKVYNNSTTRECENAKIRKYENAMRKIFGLHLTVENFLAYFWKLS